jgi:hypothetical protein
MPAGLSGPVRPRLARGRLRSARRRPSAAGRRTGPVTSPTTLPLTSSQGARGPAPRTSTGLRSTGRCGTSRAPLLPGDHRTTVRMRERHRAPVLPRLDTPPTRPSPAARAEPHPASTPVALPQPPACPATRRPARWRPVAAALSPTHRLRRHRRSRCGGPGPWCGARTCRTAWSCDRGPAAGGTGPLRDRQRHRMQHPLRHRVRHPMRMTLPTTGATRDRTTRSCATGRRAATTGVPPAGEVPSG